MDERAEAVLKMTRAVICARDDVSRLEEKLANARNRAALYEAQLDALIHNKPMPTEVRTKRPRGAFTWRGRIRNG